MPEPIRVLLVDDDAQHLSMVERLLSRFDVHVESTSSAMGVSNLVRHGKPDVVLLDVNLTELNGDQLLAVARRHAPPGTQFLLYSACDEAQLRQLAKESQADGWISKSTEIEAIYGKIEEHARRKRNTQD